MDAGVTIGVIIVIAGIILFFFPPREINSFYGYRTSSSMRNKTNWDKANRYCSRLLIVFGIILLIFAVVFKSTLLNFLTLGVSVVFIYILVEVKILKV
ncbi:SdpI family protein [Bacillus sp. B-jedd]|uniref:SdpI family protein n=1 Tax=Bacillus sp. B-jedd TaxID=1476857 RepID=UPI00051555E9|nr:SdpI family protein [Bacillus sp. B-jedd]CEG26280.1 SdpC immunity factor [Bacillus sp. B-jedd]